MPRWPLLLLLLLATAACGEREILPGVTFAEDGALLRESPERAQQRLERALARALEQRLGPPWRVAVAFDRPPRERLTEDGERLWRWQELDAALSLHGPAGSGEPPLALARRLARNHLVRYMLSGGLLAVAVEPKQVQDL